MLNKRALFGLHAVIVVVFFALGVFIGFKIAQNVFNSQLAEKEAKIEEKTFALGQCFESQASLCERAGGSWQTTDANQGSCALPTENPQGEQAPQTEDSPNETEQNNSTTQNESA
ncbi:hypothetical protein D6817_05220 [Candidatus Pacearchaeota archaeon]|nr:MAG: hypothetical protein D6817_05220 [Candidatus Pacearchaeota archaeon]